MVQMIDEAAVDILSETRHDDPESMELIGQLALRGSLERVVNKFPQTRQHVVAIVGEAPAETPVVQTKVR